MKLSCLFYSRISILLWVITAGFFSCKSPSQVTKTTTSYACCVQVPNNVEPAKIARIGGSFTSDSLIYSKKSPDESEFYRRLENEKIKVDIISELSKNIHYPEMLRELDMEGRWYYEVFFEQNKIVSWTCRRSPPETILMQKEMDRVLNKFKTELFYFYPEKCVITLMVEVKLERGY